MQQPIEQILSRRFKVACSPTLVGRRDSPFPIAFTELKSEQPIRGRSLSVPAEDTFTFQVQLSPRFFPSVWVAGKNIPLSGTKPGDTFLFDLTANPRVNLETAFDTVRFYIPRGALDEIANENGHRRVGGLISKSFGNNDPIMHGIARHAVEVMVHGNVDCALFADLMAMAFHDHVISAYGDVVVRPFGTKRGGLSPRQMSRAAEFISAHLAGNPTVSEVAQACGMSSSHFARSFKSSSGIAPHQWLTLRRIERAKDLLRRTALDLSEIAAACGFVDTSHFSRVFQRYEQLTPGRWRRLAQITRRPLIHLSEKQTQ